MRDTFKEFYEDNSVVIVITAICTIFFLIVFLFGSESRYLWKLFGVLVFSILYIIFRFVSFYAKIR